MYGALGVGNTTDYIVRVPTEMAGLPSGYRVAMLDVKGRFAILEDGKMYSWGGRLPHAIRDDSIPEDQRVWERIYYG